MKSKIRFLIIGEKPTVKKVNHAKNLRIKIISQSEFLKMLDIKDF